MKLQCKSLFKGNASIGSHLYDEALKNNEEIVITYKGDSMTVKPFMFGKFFTMGNKIYQDKTGRGGTYTLKYIKFEKDEVSNECTTNRET